MTRQLQSSDNQDVFTNTENVNIAIVHLFKLTESALFQTAYNFQGLTLKKDRPINAYHVFIPINSMTAKTVLSQVVPNIFPKNASNVKLDIT